MLFFSQDKLRKLSEQVDRLGGQAAQDAERARQALEDHAQALSGEIAAVREAENRHDMAIEDMLDAWEAFQQTLNGAVERLSDGLSDRHARAQEEADRRERRLLNLAMACGDQLFALRRAAPEGAWQRQLALSEAQFAENAMGCGLQVVSREGDPFSPSLHEVVDVTETREPDQSLRVAEVYTCGYIYAGRVVRKASVRVWRMQTNDGATEDET